ncbi:MAG TPA: 4-(cytidine 5'-diphospho)-2-C-methyl-D-erythritol kinase [Burkholderiaceae bacterium]
MQALYDVPAPAKLNLFLHITGRRADGYHLLQSVFMLIDWADSLHFEPRRDSNISREDIGPALPADDLTVRAARALQAATGCALGVHISVAKRIPAQAGMGGGSSDAASCLLALNRLWQLHLPLQKLKQIGLALGADVPFFLRGRNAWVEGIGETITPLTGAATLPRAEFAVVRPDTGLDTGLIFSAPALKRDTKAATISGFAADHYGFGRNDLQSVAQALCPGVAQATTWLDGKGLKARMTGSGSAVFAFLPRTVDLTDIPCGWQARKCSNLDVHPLAGWAPSDNSSVGA